MTPVGRLFIAASIGALAACGSSRTPAPVVYGTPVSQPYAYGAEPYRAPAAQPAYAAQRPASPAYAPPSQSYAPAVYGSASSPAQLTPVSAEPLDQPQRPAITAQNAYGQPAYPYQQPTYQPAPQPPVYQPAAPQAPVYQPVSASGPRPGGWTTVQPGETVYAIARRTGAKPQAIIAENNLYPPYRLEIGQSLRVPGAPGAPSYPSGGYGPGSGYQPQPSQPSAPATRIVRPGETLFSISRDTRVPVNRLADVNRLAPPYALQIGQPIVIPGRESAVYAEAPRAPNSIDVADLTSTISYTSPRQPLQQRLFDWPVRGAVISSYGAGAKGRRNDGVNIAAPVGTPVHAAADGEVVYRGSELDGYGNLLLVKHRDGFVTAYAHNDIMLVRKGQQVKQGQIIAKVGQTGAVSEPQLHFEIRQDLKSVDPLAFLQ